MSSLDHTWGYLRQEDSDWGLIISRTNHVIREVGPWGSPILRRGGRLEIESLAMWMDSINHATIMKPQYTLWTPDSVKLAGWWIQWWAGRWQTLTPQTAGVESSASGSPSGCACVSLFWQSWSMSFKIKLQARILEWVAIPFSRGSSLPRDWTWVSCITGRSSTIWATREAWSISFKIKL